MARSDDARSGPAFLLAVGFTAWLAGLLLAGVFGMLSVYLVLSAGFIGSRLWGYARRELLGSGDR